MTVVEGVLKFIVTIFSFAKAQRKMEWVQSQLQIALDRVDQIEDQIQAQNAFARGFMTGILATFVVFAAPLLVTIFGMMVWMIAHSH